MSDPILLKQAIFQITLALLTTVSIPWSAIKLAWASSIHEVEEGSLTLTDLTQWTINRLSASQIALAQPQAGTTSLSKKAPASITMKLHAHTKVTMELTLIFVHNVKKRKQFSHPEHKSNAKQIHSNKIQQNSS